MAQTTGQKQPTKKELLAEIAALRQAVEELQQEKEDLEMVLEMTTDHSDTVEEELHTKAEEALRRSEQQLRMIVEATPAPVIITRLADGKIVYANAMAGPLRGLSTEELLGLKAAGVDENLADRQALMDALAEQG